MSPTLKKCSLNVCNRILISTDDSWDKTSITKKEYYTNSNKRDLELENMFTRLDSGYLSNESLKMPIILTNKRLDVKEKNENICRACNDLNSDNNPSNDELANLKENINFNKDCTHLKGLRDVNTDKEETSSIISESTCSGYHSSDFEIIDENEAKLFNCNDCCGTMENNKDIEYSPLQFPRNTFEALSNIDGNTFCHYNFRENYNRLNAVIPEGDSYINLFRTKIINNLGVPFLKKRLSLKECNGFDTAALILRHCAYETDKYVKEAIESEKKIVTMYPRHNRRYRKDFQIKQQ